MKTTKNPFKKTDGEKTYPKSYRIYRQQESRVKKLSKLLSTKEIPIGESEVVRDAIDEMYAYYFNR